MRVKLDSCVPQTCGKRIHVVGDSVAFGRWGGRVRGERFVRSIFRVETDEEFVVVELGDGAGEGNRPREVSYVVEGCGCVQGYCSSEGES